MSEENKYTYTPNDQDILNTWCRDSLVRETVELLMKKKSIVLYGPKGCGKTNLILNCIIPFLSGDVDCDPINRAFGGAGKSPVGALKVDFVAFRNHITRDDLVRELKGIMERAGFNSSNHKLDNKATYQMIGEKFIDIVRDYMRSRRLDVFYVILNEFDLSKAAVDFLKSVEPLCRFVIAFRGKPPKIFVNSDVDKRCERLYFDNLHPDEAIFMAKKLLEVEQVRLDPNVWKEFIGMVKYQYICWPGGIVERIRDIKRWIHDEDGRPITAKALREKYPAPPSRDSHKYTVVVHYALWFIALCLFNQKVLVYQNASLWLFGVGVLIVVLMFAYRMSEAQSSSEFTLLSGK